VCVAFKVIIPYIPTFQPFIKQAHIYSFIRNISKEYWNTERTHTWNGSSLVYPNSKIYNQLASYLFSLLKNKLTAWNVCLLLFITCDNCSHPKKHDAIVPSTALLGTSKLPLFYSTMHGCQLPKIIKIRQHTWDHQQTGFATTSRWILTPHPDTRYRASVHNLWHTHTTHSFVINNRQSWSSNVVLFVTKCSLHNRPLTNTDSCSCVTAFKTSTFVLLKLCSSVINNW
jgi:hypothetical protein